MATCTSHKQMETIPTYGTWSATIQAGILTRLISGFMPSQSTRLQ